MPTTFRPYDPDQRPATVPADAGYCNEADLATLEARGGEGRGEAPGHGAHGITFPAPYPHSPADLGHARAFAVAFGLEQDLEDRLLQLAHADAGLPLRSEHDLPPMSPRGAT